jgi:hypothetical protein
MNLSLPLKENKANPYSGFVWNAVDCDYCSAAATHYCIVKGSRASWRPSGRVAHEIHSGRYLQQKQAYHAWEAGRKRGLSEIRDRLHDALIDMGIVVAPAHLYNRMLERIDALKAENDELKAPAEEAC